VRLTTAHYFTPSGRNIQKPYENGLDEYKSDYLDRISTGQLFSADSIHLSDSLKFKTLVNGRDVYGGGGVMPDIFIPMDTSSYYRYYNRLRRNNIVYNYVLDYVDQNRSEIKNKYPEFNAFNNKFEVTEEMVNSILADGEKQGIEKDEESLKFTLNNMKKEVKRSLPAIFLPGMIFTKYFFRTTRPY
jgi:carboxyl-terminal processing protease